MRIFVEANFLIELALKQEESGPCEELFALAESGVVRLIVPAFSLVEATATVRRRVREREGLLRELRPHCRRSRARRRLLRRRSTRSRMNSQRSTPGFARGRRAGSARPSSGCSPPSTSSHSNFATFNARCRSRRRPHFESRTPPSSPGLRLCRGTRVAEDPRMPGHPTVHRGTSLGEGRARASEGTLTSVPDRFEHSDGMVALRRGRGDTFHAMTAMGRAPVLPCLVPESRSGR